MTDAVAAPVPVTVTVAFELTPPDVGGTYRTAMVQLPPGFRTTLDAQVPPVMLKVPLVPVLVIVGAAVKWNAPPAEAELLTVIVPFFVVLLDGEVVNAGVGPEKLSEACPAAAVTVNVTALLVPRGVLTVMLWAPSAAVAPMFSVAVTDVELAALKLLTVMVEVPVFTPVAPVRFAPVMVTLTLVPRAPELGLIELSVGGPTMPSMAPMSKCVVSALSGRGLPKKSVVG